MAGRRKARFFYGASRGLLFFLLLCQLVMSPAASFANDPPPGEGERVSGAPGGNEEKPLDGGGELEDLPLASGPPPAAVPEKPTHSWLGRWVRGEKPWYVPSFGTCVKSVIAGGIAAGLAIGLYVKYVNPPVKERDRWADIQAQDLNLPDGVGETPVASLEANRQRFRDTLMIVSRHLIAKGVDEDMHNTRRLKPAEVWLLLVQANEPEGVPPNNYPVGEIRRLADEAGIPAHVWLDPRHWTTFYQDRENRDTILRLIVRALELDWDYFYKPELGPLAEDATVQDFIKRQMLRYREPIR